MRQKIILQSAKKIVDNFCEYHKNENHIAFFIRDELSNKNYDRKKIVEAWESKAIFEIAKARNIELIDERKKIIQRQRESYYRDAPKQEVNQKDGEITVEYGRVKNISEMTYHDFFKEGKIDWNSYNEHRMGSRKKCQKITLENDNREFRVVFGVNSIGVKKLDVIKFTGVVNGEVVNIPSISSVSGINTFNISIPIRLAGNWYPSIAAAYVSNHPELSYGYITQLIRNGMAPDEAFLKTKQLNKGQVHGNIVKMPISKH